MATFRATLKAKAFDRKKDAKCPKRLVIEIEVYLGWDLTNPFFVRIITEILYSINLNFIFSET